MSYSNTKVRRNQQHFKDPQVLSHIKEDPAGYMSNFSRGKLAVMKQLFYWSSKVSNIYISQSRLAKVCRLSREHVNRILSDLEKDGLVALYYRHMKTSMYKVSSFFTEEIRASVSFLFRVFPLSLLLSIPATEATLKETSHNTKLNNIYIINRTVDREFMSQARRSNRTAFNKKERKEMLLPSQKKDLIKQLIAGTVPKDFIPQAIQEVKSIKLSTYGGIKLMAFPDFIIKQADKQTHKATNLREPFRFFFSKCVALCKEKNIKPDWLWVDEIKKALQLNDDISPIKAEPAVERHGEKEITLEKAITHNKKIQIEYRRLDCENNVENLHNTEEHIRNQVAKNPQLAFILNGILDNIEKQKLAKL